MIKIITYKEIQEGTAIGIADYTETVFSAVVDTEYWYRKMKHKGMLQTNLKDNQFVIVSDNAYVIDNYITENNLIEFVPVVEFDDESLFSTKTKSLKSVSNTIESKGRTSVKSKLYDIDAFNKKIVLGLVLSTISIIGLGILIFLNLC